MRHPESMWLRISELTQEIERLKANSKLMEAAIATLKEELVRLKAENKRLHVRPYIP